MTSPATNRVSLTGTLPTGIGRAIAAAVLVVMFTSCDAVRREPARPSITGPAADAPRIAVLTFDNLGDANDGFFASGITDEISDRLTAVAGLAVISRSSSAVVGEDSAPAHEIAGELDAEHLLLGTFRLDRQAAEGPRIELEARLLAAADGSRVWSASFDRPLDDLFAVQAEVARGVVEGLGVELLESERRLLEARPTANMAAYEAYLRGLPLRWSFGLRELQSAEHLFLRAVELDPDFALAYAALSEVHSQLFHFRYDRSPQRLAAAVAAAHRALEIDPGLAEGHRALGAYYYWGQRNYAEALAEFTIAAEGRPSDALVAGSIGVVLRRQGRWDEALEALHGAARVNPKSEVNVIDLASTFGRMRRWEEGIARCRQAIRLAPDDIFPYVFCARMERARDGDLDSARELLEQMPDVDPAQQAFYRYEQAVFERDFSTAMVWLEDTDETISDPITEEVMPRSLAVCECAVYAGSPAAGVPECGEARASLERQRDASPGDPALYAALGWAYALNGDREEASASGERAVTLLPVADDAMAGHSYLVRLAKIYARVDEPYLAVKTTQKALALPGWLSIAIVQLDPAWDPIRTDPRYRELLRIHGAAD